MIPSPLEEHLGQIWDPSAHSAEIADANRVLEQFLEDMHANRAPSSDLRSLRQAAGTLGLYAGYPSDVSHMESFLESRAAASYRTTESFLKNFVPAMNELIQLRLLTLRLRASGARALEPDDPLF